LGKFLQLLLVDLARTAVLATKAVLHRRRALSSSTARFRLTAGAVASVLSGTPTFRHVLQFLDHLVEAEDDLLLDVLRLLAGASEVKAATAVVHQLADIQQVLLVF